MSSLKVGEKKSQSRGAILIYPAPDGSSNSKLIKIETKRSFQFEGFPKTGVCERRRKRRLISPYHPGTKGRPERASFDNRFSSFLEFLPFQKRFSASIKYNYRSDKLKQEIVTLRKSIFFLLKINSMKIFSIEYVLSMK